jgi:hypothetical protein
MDRSTFSDDVGTALAQHYPDSDSETVTNTFGARLARRGEHDVGDSAGSADECGSDGRERAGDGELDGAFLQRGQRDHRLHGDDLAGRSDGRCERDHHHGDGHGPDQRDGLHVHGHGDQLGRDRAGLGPVQLGDSDRGRLPSSATFSVPVRAGEPTYPEAG